SKTPRDPGTLPRGPGLFRPKRLDPLRPPRPAATGRHDRRGGHLASPRAQPPGRSQTTRRRRTAPPGHAPMISENLVLGTSTLLFAIGAAGGLVHPPPRAMLIAGARVLQPGQPPD